MLSGLPITAVALAAPASSGAAVVSTIQVIARPISVTVGQSSPVISKFGASNSIGPFWTFSGKITDGNNPVVGRVVTFGGVLAKYHITATVQADGTFSVTKYLPSLETGTATAQTSSIHGMASNLAMCGIINPRLAGN